VNKDQSYGGLILIVSVIVLIGYLFSLTIPGIGQLVVNVVVSIAVLGILGITGWIGWTMLTTPPPAPLEAELGTSGPSSTAGTSSGASTAASKPDEKH
jgi:hypothetical protein